MHIEYECTLLDVDKDEISKLLEYYGAQKKGEYFQRRYVYDFNPVDKSKWIRLRTNGAETTITIKNIVDRNSIGGTEELELAVSDFDIANSILNELGYIARNYQENKRIIYELDGISFGIDSWPLIPDYVEIEGKSEEDVINIIDKLNLDKSRITNLDVTSIYNDIYGIDILSIKELRF